MNNVNQSLYSFAGTFDGNGKLIKHLYINADITDNTNDLRLGLFCNNYGIIKNLGLVNSNMTASLDTTGNNTVIVGGFIGYNYGEINGCFVEGNLLCTGKNNAKVRVGGIAGNINNGCIKNCYSLGNIRGNGNFLTCVGGITGVANNSIIENCFNSSDLTITTTNGHLYIGGIAGNTANASINNCYNINNLNSIGTSIEIGIGGIVGYSQAISMDNCHNKANIHQNATSTEPLVVGQIAGTNYLSGSIKNCSYLKQGEYNAIGKNSVSVDESTPIEDETNMPSILDIVGSSFKNSINNGYPILNWQ